MVGFLHALRTCCQCGSRSRSPLIESKAVVNSPACLGTFVDVALIGHAFVIVVPCGLRRSFCQTCCRITGHPRRIRFAVLATSAARRDGARVRVLTRRTSYNESRLLEPRPSCMARTTRMGVLFQLSLSRFG